MNICYCGTQAGYPHRDECPYPLFRGTTEDEERWEQARQLRAEDPEYGDVEPSGQIALGVPGEQRAIDGLAHSRTTSAQDDRRARGVVLFNGEEISREAYDRIRKGV